MKRIFLLFICITVPIILGFAGSGVKVKNSTVSFSQHDRYKGLSSLEASAGHKLNVRWNKFNSTPAFVGGGLTKQGYAGSMRAAGDGIRFLTENRELFGIKEPDKELKPVRIFNDDLKMTHVKYEQRVNGIRIYYSDLIVHIKQDGSIESVNGTYVPTPEINTQPSISAEAAISAALKETDYVPSSRSAELVLYPKDNKPILAYEVLLPGSFYPNMKLFIDALDGTVLKKDDGLRYDGPVRGSGTGLNGKAKDIELYLSKGKYFMIDATLPMYKPPVDSLWGVIKTFDALNDTIGSGYLKVAFVTHLTSNFNDDERLKAAVDAHAFSRLVYNFYKSHYNRNSFDDNGSTLQNIVHFKNNYNNAFWNGKFMSYGDGDGEYCSNLAGGLDVIGHEITHGVTERTADLVYELQSGAINESISDVFGSLVDSTNWQIGEDVYTPYIDGDAMRDMSDPHNGEDYGDTKHGWQPAHMDEFMVMDNDSKHDWGGVHTNSGIPNKAFYNVAHSIGRWKAGQIWYRALTVYLTKYSQFSDLRIACLSSAKDLYGEGSDAYKAVADGFTDVGITDTPTHPELTEMIYDDGDPSASVYEDAANWKLAVKFSPPSGNYSLTQMKIYTAGDKYNGNSQFKLGVYKEDPSSGLPGEVLFPAETTPPNGTGWQIFDITQSNSSSGDFFLSVEYDGIGYPYIGADAPPGNGKAYEYDPTKKLWYKLEPPNDYTLFIRAKVKTTTAVAEIDPQVPAQFALEQNYPNPFNPSTNIRYALPAAAQVKVEVYDLTGRRVAGLVNNYQAAGTYNVTWNGVNDLGEKVSSGVYFCHIKAGSFEKTMKMSLLK